VQQIQRIKSRFFIIKSSYLEIQGIRKIHPPARTRCYWPRGQPDRAGKEFAVFARAAYRSAVTTCQYHDCVRCPPTPAHENARQSLYLFSKHRVSRPVFDTWKWPHI